MSLRDKWKMRKKAHNGFYRVADGWGCQILRNYLEKGFFTSLLRNCDALYLWWQASLPSQDGFFREQRRLCWRYPKLKKAISLPWMIYNFYGHHTQFAILECRTLIFSRSALLAMKKIHFGFSLSTNVLIIFPRKFQFTSLNQTAAFALAVYKWFNWDL